MGDRANIRLDYGKHRTEERAYDSIYLYTHWGGSAIAETLQTALERGRSRWDDDSYLARIIFNQMTAGIEMETTGIGISPYEISPDRENIVINLTEQTVNGIPFEDWLRNPVLGDDDEEEPDEDEDDGPSGPPSLGPCETS